VEDSLVLTAREVVGKPPNQGAVHKILLNWTKAGIFQFQGVIVGEVDLRNPTEALVRLKYEVDCQSHALIHGNAALQILASGK